MTDDTLIAILRRVITEPDVDVHRLVYADRLEELGQSERAGFIRNAILRRDDQLECYRFPASYSVGFDPIPITGVWHVEFDRGFGYDWMTDAATFLRHADALIWHESQTVKTADVCPKCSGKGRTGRVKCPVCDGSGAMDAFAPRPCPPTAQPIRRVRLTTQVLIRNPSDDDWSLDGY